MKPTTHDPRSRADAALDQVVALQAEIDALTARRTVAIREFEGAFADSYPASAAPFTDRASRAELACALRVPERTAERMMGEARVLVDALLDRDSGLGIGRTTLEPMGVDADELRFVQDRDLGPFRGIVPTVFVTVPASTLLGGDEPGALEGVGPIDAATARRLTAQAPELHRLLTHPETGVVLSLGRTRYAIPDGLRRWLRIRDETCRFPMCSIRTRHSDIDHTHDWANGGATDHDNLAHLSRGHHTVKHHGGWQVRQERGGRLTWTSYLGREYTTAPEVG